MLKSEKKLVIIIIIEIFNYHISPAAKLYFLNRSLYFHPQAD